MNRDEAHENCFNFLVSTFKKKKKKKKKKISYQAKTQEFKAEFSQRTGMASPGFFWWSCRPVNNKFRPSNTNENNLEFLKIFGPYIFLLVFLSNHFFH